MLTVVSAPAQGGSFTYDPPLCAAKTYASGTVVTLTAVPSEGYQFYKWSGDIGANAADNATIHVVMDMAHSITAYFVAPGDLYTITVKARPSLGGTATITTSFGSFNISGNESSVSIQYPSGTAVHLSATAAAGYSFHGWNGGVTGSQGNVSFVVNSSKTITAEFSAPSSFQWGWAVGGVAALLLVVLLIVKFMSGRAKKPDDIPPM
jgi:hypothetical protein